MQRTVVLLIVALLLGGCDRSAEPAASVETTAAATPVADLPIDAGESPAAADPVGVAKIALDGEGLRLVGATGSTRLLAFGAPRRQVEQTVSASLGDEGEHSEFRECGAGPMQFTRIDGLTLNFQQDKFLGWTLGNDAKLMTMDGIRPGTLRSVVESSRSVRMIPDSTLGAEFSLGDPEGNAMGGFFKGSGPATRVDSLYAGLTCFFR